MYMHVSPCAVKRFLQALIHKWVPLRYVSFHPVQHDWCNKGCGMSHPICGMVHIKETLLLIGKSKPCSGGWFPLSRYLSGPITYVRRRRTLNKMC